MSARRRSAASKSIKAVRNGGFVVVPQTVEYWPTNLALICTAAVVGVG